MEILQFPFSKYMNNVIAYLFKLTSSNLKIMFVTLLTVSNIKLGLF